MGKFNTTFGFLILLVLPMLFQTEYLVRHVYDIPGVRTKARQLCCGSRGKREIKSTAEKKTALAFLNPKLSRKSRALREECCWHTEGFCTDREIIETTIVEECIYEGCTYQEILEHC